MNFENNNLGINQEAKESEEKPDTDTLKSKLMKTGRVAMAAGALLAATGCDTSSKSGPKQSDKDFLEGVKQLNDVMKATESKSEAALLKNYYHHITSRTSAEITKEESHARAIEMIHAYRMRVGTEKVEFKTQLGIPVEIMVGDRHVPIGAFTYSWEEKEILGLKK